jgi:5-methylcytosine-specific restriction endonuclease McrA
MFNSLQSASSQQILAKTDSIVAQDRKLTLRLLEHLYEIDRRKLYLERGFASTFDYCTRHLKLSEPSAARRLRTARCVARYSLLYPLLESGELSLTVVAMVSKYLKPANVDEIVGRIKNKPKREVERIIAEYEPKALLPPDRVRMVVVAVPPTTVPVASRLFTVTGDSEKSPNADDAKSVVPSDQQGEAVPFASTHPRTETLQFQRLARVEFTAHEELMEKLDRLRSLMSHRLPVNATLEQLITFMADYVIAREDPAKRQERREARTTMQERVAVPSSSANPRHIPAAVRDEVSVRDRRCAYVSPDGKRCNSTHVLQVDHIQPVARGGASTIDNLRLLCAYHNRLESERLMGKRGMRDLIRDAPAAFGARAPRYDQSLVEPVACIVVRTG